MWQIEARRAVVALGLLGCACDIHREVVASERMGTAGSSGEETGGSEGDGGSPASSGGEPGSGGDTSTAVGGTTEPQRPRFAAPQPVEVLNDPDSKDQDPTVTADQLEIFFFTDREGNADIWTSRRPDVDSAWEPPVAVSELNSPEIEQNPTISRDGLRMWFYSRRDPLGVYFTQRPSREEPFGTPEPLTIPNPTQVGFPIAPSVDASELRMAISIGEAGSRDVFETVRPSLSGTWSQPVLVSGINSADYAESTPFLVDDGREMLFYSGRSGGGDLFWAYRDSPGLPFTQVAPLTEVNDPMAFDSYPHLTVDRRWIYFGSGRGGNTDIYVAEVVGE